MRHKPYRVATKKISLPVEIIARTELRLNSNSTNTGPAYAEWSKLIESLLRDWLDDAEQNAVMRDLEPKPTAAAEGQR